MKILARFHHFYQKNHRYEILKIRARRLVILTKKSKRLEALVDFVVVVSLINTKMFAFHNYEYHVGFYPITPLDHQIFSFYFYSFDIFLAKIFSKKADV